MSITQRYLPVQGPPRPVDCLRGGGGALIGLLLAGVIGQVALGSSGDLPWLVAPMGATAVLVFAVPGSPLAQPWSVVVGNVASALIGLGAAWLIDWPPLAAAAAVGIAIASMIALRCLHPPGGACALTAALAPAAVTDQGIVFAFWPVGLGSLVLVVVAVAFHTLTGRQYPHVPPAPAATAPGRPGELPPARRVGFGPEDVEAAMERLDAGLDITPADVVALVHDAETHALNRRLGWLLAGAVMTREVVTVGPGDTLFRARMLFDQHHVKALPVVDDEGGVVGIVAMSDLFNLDPADLAPVRTVMTTDVLTIDSETAVANLVDLMVDRGYHHLPVVDDGRLVGLVTRSELIEVLHRMLLRGTTPGAAPSRETGA